MQTPASIHDSVPPNSGWAPLAVGRVVEVDVVGLFRAPGRQFREPSVTGTITALGPGFICVQAFLDGAPVELTVSRLRLR
jgi:hypothetical protein